MAYNNLGTQYELLFEKNIEPLKISVISSYLDYSQNAAIVFLKSAAHCCCLVSSLTHMSDWSHYFFE